jgi:CheY-like chemotaxis protein
MPEPLRVLVVDDDSDTVFTLAKLVQHWGYDGLNASRGEDALSMAKSFRPDVVLLDMAMPGMDGIQVARDLLAMTELQGVQIIAISGHQDLDTQTRAAQIGIHHYILKPAQATEVQKLLAVRCAELGR